MTLQFHLSTRAFQTGYYSTSPNGIPLSQIATIVVMHHLGKSKVAKLNAKAGVVYPLIRLPRTCADEIGKVAEIFETQHHKRRALLVTFNDGDGRFEVIQLLPEVIQPDSKNSVESRLSTLESQLAELKSLISHLSARADSEKESNAIRQSDSQPYPKLEQKSLSSIRRLVSCAASCFACASPGSVAAYHGALSRLRLGFKSRLGRFIFDSSDA